MYMFFKILKIVILLISFSITLFGTTVNDDMYVDDSQWNLTKISIEDAWSITTGSSSIKIAIIDNGIDLIHLDLKDDIVTGYNAMDGSNNPDHVSHDLRHGTHVAGIAAATTNNDRGIAGVGYNCKIMPIKWCGVLPGTPAQYLDSDDYADAINWAWEHGADVINLSWGCTIDSDVTAAINSATTSGRGGKGCVIVCAAGNFGTIIYPATLSNVITVGMTNQSDGKISGSGIGSQLDVMAPGNVKTTDPTASRGGPGDYATPEGTSYAAPHVAGLAGLMLSANSNLTQSQVKEIIERTAYDLGATGRDNSYGWGRINAKYAVKSAAQQFTTSGQITHNECWWGTVNLTGNVTIPSGVVLRIMSNSNINLGDYKIILNGGSIQTDDYNVIHPRIELKTGSMIIGCYPSITSAFLEVSYGQSIEVYGPHTLSNDLTVPTGVGFRPQSGSELKFAAGKKLIVNGGLSCNNAIYTKSGSSSWYGIVLSSGSSGQINGSTIKNSSYGIKCYSSSPIISNSTFSGNYYAMYIYNSSPDLEITVN